MPDHINIQHPEATEYAPGPYCPVCHCFWTHGPRCEGIGWRDGEGDPIEEQK